MPERNPPKRIGAGPKPARKKGMGKRRKALSPKAPEAHKVLAHEGGYDATRGMDPVVRAALISDD